MLKITFLLILSVVWLVVTPVFAAESVSIDQLKEKTLEKGLAFSKMWVKLLHYEPSLHSSTGWRSAIHSDSFFLSPTGREDPQAELDATLNAVLAPVTVNPDKHARCRFPARMMWLRQQLDLTDKSIDPLSCPQFDAWSYNGTVESVSIVFATGYLGNPASYYGHTLLKLNSKLQSKQTTLLDTSVNYGAIIPDGEDPVTYIVKGVTGGYDGGFSHIEYYFHTHNYGENELRDLWEYELDLAQPSVDIIVAHAWETLGKKYTYYFFRKNCAYRMAELIEIVEGVDIIPDNRPFTIPQALIRKVGAAKAEGRALVEKIIYHPSRQSRLYQRYLLLDEREKEFVEEWVLAMGQNGSPPPLSDYDQIDTLLDYYQFVLKSNVDQSAETSEAYRRVLLQRYQLPPRSMTEVNAFALAPHSARPPSRLALGLIHSSVMGNGVELQVRPAYYDHLDSDSAHVRNSVLTMADLRLQLWGDSLRVDQFDIINIESANTAVTGLPGDNREAWMIRAGLVRPDSVCRDCLIPRIEGAWGSSYTIRDSIDITGMVGASAQERSQGYDYLNALATGRVVARLSPVARIQLYCLIRTPIQQSSGTSVEDGLEFRYRVTPSLDFRVRYESDKAKQLIVSLGTYW